jgi:hypothetical protein
VPDNHRIDLDLAQPRSVAEILITAVRLFVRRPVLFLALALVVVGPYDLLVLAITGTSPLGQGHSSGSTDFILSLVDLALVGPLVSALQVQAVLDIGEGVRPKLTEILARGLRVLPVVAAAEIIADIGIGVGLFLLVIPGIVLAVRFFVVAQTAAVEHTDWPGALRRSGQLVRGNYLRTFGVFILVTLVSLLLIDVGVAVAGTAALAVQMVVIIFIEVITRSFQAISTAILYFDLRAREQALTMSQPLS